MAPERTSPGLQQLRSVYSTKLQKGNALMNIRRQKWSILSTLLVLVLLLLSACTAAAPAPAAEPESEQAEETPAVQEEEAAAGESLFGECQST